MNSALMALAVSTRDEPPPASPAVARVLAALCDAGKTVTRSGTGWMAQCPAHDDHTPSLSVAARPDGGVRLHCFANCAPADVWAALGLRAPATRVAYDYVDSAGTLRYQVVRSGQKTFRQRHRCPTSKRRDGWTWGLGGNTALCRCEKIDRLLYRLPDVIRAAQQGETVCIPEGEKDADRLRALGFTATCNSGGAGKWDPAYGAALRGAHVVIFPDNDPPGAAHAEVVAQSCAASGAASVKVVPLPGVPPKGDVSDWLDAGHDADALRGLMKAAPAWTPTATKPLIVVREALNAVTGEAEAALRARPDLHVYVRARMLMTVTRDGSRRETWVRRAPGSPVIVPLELARMRALLDEAACWIKDTGKGQRDTTPPPWVADQLLAQLEWTFPYLEGIIEIPTLRADGSILDTPGWDEATRLLYDPPPGRAFPPIPAQPTRADVDAAKQRLLDPVTNFPFVAASDRAAYVAAVLTLLARHMIQGPVPLFAIRAPTPGTGKTLLASVIGGMGIGREPAVMGGAHDEIEWQKLLLALALDGTPLVLLDNLDGALGSNALAGALTSGQVEGRRLGRSESARAPLRATWLATGNNLGFKRTLGRRVIPVDLDAGADVRRAGVEAPEDRTTFRYPDLLQHVRAHRADYVVAGLTVLRAFHVAGRPAHGEPRMGSFEAWDDLIRGAVIWAGLDDPASLDAAKGRGRLRTQVEDDMIEVGDLVQKLYAHYGDGTWWHAREALAVWELEAAFNSAAPHRGGEATPHSVGVLLRRIVNRPIGGLQVESMSGGAGKSVRWCVRKP